EDARQRGARDPRAAALAEFKLGLLLKDQDRWQEAERAFSHVAEVLPKYGETHRELGIARNKLLKGTAGVEDLERAIKLNPADFDALSSLGGIYKRAGQASGSESQARKLLRKSVAL